MRLLPWCDRQSEKSVKVTETPSISLVDPRYGPTEFLKTATHENNRSNYDQAADRQPKYLFDVVLAPYVGTADDERN